MARALLLGCGCCARLGGGLLLERGWAVRGTSRDPARLEAIEAAGIEAALADPDRVGTIVEQLGDVTVLAWLLGAATGSERELVALHEERLPSLVEKLVDSPVRGLLLEGSGSVPAPVRERALAEAERLAGRSRIPFATIAAELRPDPDRWARELADAVERVALG